MNSTRSPYIYKHVNIYEWIKIKALYWLNYHMYIHSNIRAERFGKLWRTIIDWWINKTCNNRFWDREVVHLYDVKSNVYAIQARGIGQGASPPPPKFSRSKLIFSLNLQIEYWIFMELPPPPNFLGTRKKNWIKSKEGSR